MIAFRHSVGGRLVSVALWTLLGAQAFLILTGVFPEESPNNLHVIVSTASFHLLTASEALLLVPLDVSSAFGRMSGILAGVALAAAIVLIAGDVPAVPFPEHLAVFTGILWSGWNIWRLYRSAPA